VCVCACVCVCVSESVCVGDEADGLQMIHDSMKEFGLQDRDPSSVTRGTNPVCVTKLNVYLLLRLSGEVRMGQQYINITTRLCS